MFGGPVTVMILAEFAPVCTALYGDYLSLAMLFSTIFLSLRMPEGRLGFPRRLTYDSVL